MKIDSLVESNFKKFLDNIGVKQKCWIFYDLVVLCYVNVYKMSVIHTQTPHHYSCV